MSAETVAEISPGLEDMAGEKIETVYTKVRGKYAVYGTAVRVMVHFSDDDWLGTEQRKALIPLSAIRGEINGLIDDWRTSNKANNLARARILDRRSADALVVALQGDTLRAAALLDAVKADALEERMSSARSQYLMIAFLCFLAIPFAFILASILHDFWPSARLALLIGSHQWWPVSLGALGALFSISIFIRNREVVPDLQSRDNTMDAVLRIFIGAVSAVILVSLIQGKLVAFGFGESPITVDWGRAEAFPVATVVAFAAGFSERMVGSYLSSAFTQGSAEGATSATVSAAIAGLPGRAASEDSPRSANTADRRLKVVDDHVEDDALHEAHIDGCLCDVEISEGHATADEELPFTEGGVAEKVA